MSIRAEKIVRIFWISILIASNLAACAPRSEIVEPDDRPGEVALVRSEVQRDTSPQVDEAGLVELAAGNSAFAFDLYQALRGERGNLFYSPFSISIALAMTYAGARGETERQMAETLHYTLPQEQLHPAFNAVDQALAEGEKDEAAFRLSVANSLWGQQGFPFRQEFLDVIAKNYGAGMHLVDYRDGANREQARQAINAWVSEETQAKIEELIGEDILNELARLVLANAIYFKGEWVEPFLSGTQEAPFTRLDGSQVSAPMMSRRMITPYAQGEDFQAVELPYKGERISMVVLLPAEGQFEDFESSLDSDRVEAILQALSPHDLKLYLPKFNFSTELMLAETLEAMGMPEAFDGQRADFSGMYDPGQTSEGNLYLSHVIHKAFVAVDEKGTEAAAATGVVAGIVSMPEELLVDRPFIFLIRDQHTGAILFVGRVMDPTD
jgi:serpin B